MSVDSKISTFWVKIKMNFWKMLQSNIYLYSHFNN